MMKLSRRFGETETLIPSSTVTAWLKWLPIFRHARKDLGANSRIDET
jgi:hypothetical protein